jgi:hypothetical protein
MAPTFCNRCKDEGCGLWDELAELDASPERILERYDLKRKINRFHSPIVRKLPPDVTSTVFEFCLTDLVDHQLSPYDEMDLSFPLSLGAICNYWREIAWSTPTLWSSLVVRVSSKQDSHVINSIAQEWLSRSGQLPLSIYIRTKSVTVWLYHQISALANIVNHYSSRWSNLDLYIPRLCYQYFHGLGNGTATILKSIRFHCLDNVMDLDFPLTCPRLERVNLTLFSLSGTSIQWDNLTHLTLLFTRFRHFDATLTIIQWDNLTHLSLLSSMSTFESFLILRKTPRLAFCTISGFPSSDKEPIGAPVLTLASLRSLHLITHFAKYILNNLIAPRLEELSLPKFYIQSMDIPMEVVTSFLGRSAVHGSLRVLKLDRYPATPIPVNRVSYVSSLVEQGTVVNVLSKSDNIVQSSNSSPGMIWAVIVYQVM